MLTRAHGGGNHLFLGFRTHRAARQRHPERRCQHSLGARPYLERRCVLVDEAQVRERIERTGVSDAKKRASYPLAKRAGARCAF